MKIFLGIDPGLSGAMAAIMPKNIRIWDFEDGEILLWLQEIDKAFRDDITLTVKAVIEKQQAYPKQGVSSTFKTGKNFGQWIGRFEALRIPFDFVTPQKWRKVMFDSMSKVDLKIMSLDRARRLFPQMTIYLKRKKDHHRAEALLLAAYCQKINSF